MKRQLLFILLFALIVTSCNNRFDTAPAQRELNNNRNLWRSQGVGNYSYILDSNLSCLCDTFWGVNKVIQVSNNEVYLVALDEESYRYNSIFGVDETFLISNTLEVKPEYFRYFFTIEGWFDRIQNTIDAINEQQNEPTFPIEYFIDPSEVNVICNQEYGYPVSILLAVANSIADGGDGTSYISNFQTNL